MLEIVKIIGEFVILPLLGFLALLFKRQSDLNLSCTLLSKDVDNLVSSRLTVTHVKEMISDAKDSFAQETRIHALNNKNEIMEAINALSCDVSELKANLSHVTENQKIREIYSNDANIKKNEQRNYA